MNSFIKQLIKENKIKLIEVSEEISQSYTNKSKKSLLSAKTLLEIENFDDATALIYYSMYNISLALLFKTGIKSENHTGTIILIKELFNINDTEIKKAKKERIDKQYYVDFKATKEEVKEGIETAHKYISMITEKIETIKNSEIKKIKQEFEKNYF
jgi:uncharacterized protein (UPF0332 family)